MIIESSEKDFENSIKDGVVIVDFYADWCGPCKMLGSILEEVIKENKDLKIVKINVDTNNELASRFNVMSIPTLLLYKNNKFIDKKMGFLTKEMILNWIK